MNQNIKVRERPSLSEAAVADIDLHADDVLKYKTHWKVDKWSPDQVAFCADRLRERGITVVQNGLQTIHDFQSDKAKRASEILGRDVADIIVTPNLVEITDQIVPSALLRAILGDKPECGVAEQDGNILLNVGIQGFEDLLAGKATPTLWDSTNARIGVGDSTTAESASQTALQASTNKTFVGMNATYPSRSSQTLSWQADHTSSNFAWQEVCVDNGSSTHILLNRKVTSLGTKTTGTWTITLTIAIS